MISLFAVAIVTNWTFSVETRSPIGVVDWPAKESPVAVVSNVSGKALSLRGDIAVCDFYEHRFAIPVDARIPAHGEWRTKIPVGPGRVAAKGVWRTMAMLADSSGAVATNETRFAVLDPHPVTPYVPFGTFRMGIHCHLMWMPPEMRETALDAIVRMGAKIVRLDSIFRAESLWDKKNNCISWEKSDWIMGELEKRGLAVDALMLEVMTRHTDDFATRLAKRYGTRIDYYECGNEWDFLSTNKMTIAQAVENQKRTYVALKKGDPRVRVATNGFAAPDSDSHAAIKQKGFHETLVREAKGYYDIHAVHAHCTFRQYVDWRRKLFEMRRREGVTAPIFESETALLLRYIGEKNVSEHLWKKILYAWSIGATDYIWYNLKALKPLPGGYYGIMTYDMRPRLHYAAFSGLTACLGGAKFERTLVDKEGRMAFLFRRGAETILAGWDEAAVTPANVRVKTDARKAYIADMMNNRSEVPVAGGESVWQLSASPAAFVLEGASYAEPVAADLEAVCKRAPVEVVVERDRPDGMRQKAYDFRLIKYEQVHELYPADPATEFRTWKGTGDLSVTGVFRRDDTKCRVELKVYDDKDAPGDRIQFFMDGRDATAELNFSRRRGKDACGPVTWYSGTLPDMKPFRFNLRVHDDDGFGGPDCWMDHTPFDADSPDVSDWMLIRIE